MEAGIYDNKVLIDHFINPRNLGRIEDADGIGLAGDPSCSDYVKVYIKIENLQLVDIKYEVHGCPSAVATSSVFSELVKGKSVVEAQLIDNEDIVEALHGLPEQKLHCSCMAVEAFDNAVIDWVIKTLPGSEEEIQSIVNSVQSNSE
ncbi:MAG: iron-sulfur cluster assembly scaffold protein [Desulfotomaculaceae bacterium]|nr:iron-sulfur cluster assembly scaffold protein [Desulfotomaculaceae bacterium]